MGLESFLNKVNQFAEKVALDIKAIRENFVTLSTTQTITGSKTFEQTGTTRFQDGTGGIVDIKTEGHEGYVIVEGGTNIKAKAVVNCWEKGGGYVLYLNNQLRYNAQVSHSVAVIELKNHNGWHLLTLRHTISDNSMICQFPQSNMKFGFGVYADHPVFSEGFKFVVRQKACFLDDLQAKSIKKRGYSDDYILLAGGGHHLKSDFVLQSQLSNYVQTGEMNNLYSLLETKADRSFEHYQVSSNNYTAVASFQTQMYHIKTNVSSIDLKDGRWSGQTIIINTNTLDRRMMEINGRILNFSSQEVSNFVLRQNKTLHLKWHEKRKLWICIVLSDNI